MRGATPGQVGAGGAVPLGGHVGGRRCRLVRVFLLVPEVVGALAASQASLAILATPNKVFYSDKRNEIHAEEHFGGWQGDRYVKPLETIRL